MTVDTAVPQQSVPPAPRPRRPQWLIAIVVAIALVVGGVWFQRWHHNRAPYLASAVHPRLDGLQVLTPNDPSATNVRDALHALGAHGAAAAYDSPRGPDPQYIVGRIDLTAHKAPSGSQYAMVIIDNRGHSIVDDISGDPQSRSSGDGAGAAWDYGMSKFAKKYSWLSALANGPDDGADLGVFFTPGPARAVPFVAVLHGDSLPVTNIHQDLTFALVMLGPDRQPYWATRLR
jgi:hypothetical protein